MRDEVVTCIFSGVRSRMLVRAANASDAGITARFAKPPMQVKQNYPIRRRKLVLGLGLNELLKLKKLISAASRCGAGKVAVPVQKLLFLFESLNYKYNHEYN